MAESMGSGETQFTVMQVPDWITRWDQNQTGFHKAEVHPLLSRNISKLINGRENLRIFFPLCGKSVDMKWLADQGHSVYGVEAAEKALCEFFKEQDVSYRTEPVPSVGGTVFKSDDPKLQLFCCDFYNFSKNVVGQFDAMWDRGALVAINRTDRKKCTSISPFFSLHANLLNGSPLEEIYASLIKSLMAPGCRCLLSTLEYDQTKYKGPPHNVSDDEVQELYALQDTMADGERQSRDVCTVDKIDREDAFEEKHRDWEIDSLYENIFLITLKDI